MRNLKLIGLKSSENRLATMNDATDLNVITEKIIGCAFKVGNTLGAGFLEKVYENALAHEIRKAGLSVEQQAVCKVVYDSCDVGDYFADLLVEKSVMVELKVVKELDSFHLAQCMNYLRATGLSLCLLINFYRPKVEVRRIINKPVNTANGIITK
jgi:GxxExxY protein